MIILPAMNTIWFWFWPEKDRRRLHGSPEDVMRKYDVLKRAGLCDDGLEIYLTPSKLSNVAPFTSEFINEFRSLEHNSIHIGDSDPDFLDSPQAVEDLDILSKVADQLESKMIILHAHHLKKNRSKRRDLLLTTLKNVDILVENNGFDNPWGSQSKSLEEIFKECLEFKFCLDIAHINDFEHTKMDDFIQNDIIMSRLREIHYSYSTILLDSDPYEKAGYKGYSPYHALFSILDFLPSKKTIEFIKQFPIVLEGIVPPEDIDLNFLKKERDIICHT